VAHDLKKISPSDKQRTLRRIEDVLGSDPSSGDPLHGEFEGLFKLRVGEYRVVYAHIGQDVLVLRIRHRSNAYG
jgi:mRNA interferase RelE/StbE